MLSRLLLTFALMALFPSSGAQAERRVALVIGNAQYAHAPALRNPHNDAADMAETLRRVGFEVVLGVDLGQRAFAGKVEEFARAIEGADVALFYYAGHGLQINGKNYLVSTDAQLTSEFLVPTETIELDSVVRLMESKTAVSLVFLDACRNNPLAEALRRNLVALKRGVLMGRGLARVEPTGRDTLIAFAAAPGEEAADGAERNSPFTRALLTHIVRPAQEISVMLKEVAADVRRDTRNTQRPQQVTDMTRTFYFAKGDQVAAADTATPEPPRGQAQAEPRTAPASDDRALDIAYWNAAQAANECGAMKAYLARFPNGIFAELAKLSERRLCAQQTVEVTPPAAAPPAAPRPQAAPAPTAPQPPAAAAPAREAAPVIPPPAAATTPAAPSPSHGSSAPAVSASPGANPGAPPGAAQPPASAPRTASVPETPAVQPGRATTAVEVPPPSAPDEQTVRVVQRELLRVGCAADEPDGVWGPRTEEAVIRFNEHGRWRFDVSGPSPALLAALQRSGGRVCPLECGEGTERRGGTCVAIKRTEPAPAPAKKKVEPRREREKRRATREPQEPRPRRADPPRQRTAPPRERAARPAAPTASSRPGLRCRFVQRQTGGGYSGDTVEVCD